MKKIILSGVEVLIEGKEKYMQVNDVPGSRIGGLWEEIKAGFDGLDVFFCFHNTDAPTDFLHSIGAFLADDTVEMRLRNEGESLVPFSLPQGITTVTEGNFAAFADFHDRHNPEMYHTSKRVKEKPNIWQIFLLQQQKDIQGYLMIMKPAAASGQSEIFCLQAENFQQSEKLLQGGISQRFKCGDSEILYMADKGSFGQKAAAALGFKTVGKYQGYSVKVRNERK